MRIRFRHNWLAGASCDVAGIRLRARRLGLAAFLVAAGAVPVVAQTRLYLLTAGTLGGRVQRSPCEPGRVIQVDLDRRQIVAQTRSSLRELVRDASSVTPDGRHLV